MPNNFFAELRRRNVHKVALTYTVIAWLLIQLALIPALEVPSWAIETLVVLLIIGFVTLVTHLLVLRSNAGRNEARRRHFADRSPPHLEP